jgi:hypothetical protein
MHPKSWLSRYRNTSIVYLTTMLLFYHGLGFVFTIIGMFVVENTISNYQEHALPRSLVSVLTAGPIEETLFFGIPFYAFGNHIVLLIGGIAWAMIHILNTSMIDIRSLAYANWLFVVPSFFFSIRTWISGKGWFAIIAHSAWNAIFFSFACVAGENSCVSLRYSNNQATEIILVIVAGALLGLTFFLHRTKSNKIH